MAIFLELFRARTCLTLKSKSVMEVLASCYFSLRSEVDTQNNSYLNGKPSNARLVKSFGSKVFFGKA